MLPVNIAANQALALYGAKRYTIYIMLSLGSSVTEKPIMSLRTGQPVGQVLQPIINPNNLKIEGWYALDRFNKQRGILLGQDIRDILPQGIVVNDHEAITDQAELVRLKDTLELDFQVIGKPVYTTHRKRIGKVEDFAFEKNGFFIQKLYVGQSLIKSFSGGSATVDRTQIVEITDRRIVVKEATVPEKAIAAAPIPAQ